MGYKFVADITGLSLSI